MASYISCFTATQRWLKHYKVPKAVYIYIHQLEWYIKRPTQSKLKEVYNFRFK